MTKYKVCISIDGENFFWVIIENICIYELVNY